MIDDVYSQKILQFAGNISHLGKMEDADASAERTSRLCGSKLKVYIKADAGRVTDFSQEVKACALGQASAAIFAIYAVGATFDEVRDAQRDMKQMLEGSSSGPEGRFAEAQVMAPVRDYKSRHGSVMLVFDAAVAAIDDIEAQSSSSIVVQGQT